VIDGLSAVFFARFGCGFIMVLLSMLTGVGHLSFHLGDLHIHFGHVGHADLHVGSPAIGHIAHASDGATPFTAMSILTFITWFGGIGYLLHGPFGVWGGVSALAALLAGLAAVLLVAVVYFHKDTGMPGTNIPGQVSAEPGGHAAKPKKMKNGIVSEDLDPSAGSDSDPIIHLPKPPPPSKDVFVRPMR